MRKIYAGLFLMFAAMSVKSQNPFLLKDVYPGATGSGIQEIVKISGFTFFNALDGSSADRGLYRTDGTTAGTIKLNLTYPTYISTKAEKLTALGNKIIFAGDNFSNYGEIWSSDGTQSGTVALERFQPTYSNFKPVSDMTAMGGYVYYGITTNNNLTQLRRTDGTAAGTTLVYEFSSYSTPPEIGIMKALNGILYFNIYNRYGDGNDEVWRSDGTTAGTYRLRDMGTEYFLMGFFMQPVNGIVTFMTGKFDPVNFANSNAVLFSTDGTPAGTVPLKEFAGAYNNNLYPSFAAIGNTLYFSANDGANGKELWKTNGTPAGTVMIADINPGAASSSPGNLTVLNSQLYFSASTVAEGNELWKFDGSSASLIKDINPGAANSGIGSLAVSNNAIVFRALTASTGSELWITDGTTANTQQVADINPGTANSVPNFITPGNPVYFSANNGVNGLEIFKYNNNGEAIQSNRRFYVNDNNTTGDVYTLSAGNDINNGSIAFPFATLSYALSQAQAGDTIFIDAGMYATPDITLDKSITIYGSNYQVTPNDVVNPLSINNNRNADAIISGSTCTIGASNIRLQGLKFDAGNKVAILLSNSAATNNNFGDFSFEKNIVSINNTSNNINQFAITGKFVASPNMPVTSGYYISDNRFEKNSAATGNTINLNYLKNISVTNNAFVVTGSTFRTQQAANLGGTGLVEGFNFSNNTINDASAVVGGNRIASALITGNNMHNINNPLSNNNNMPESSTIEFSNNIVGNDLGTPFMLYTRSGTSLPGTSNLFKLENNIFTGVSTATDNQLFSTTLFTINNSVLNPSVIIKGNKFTYSGDFSAQNRQFFRPVTVRGNVADVTIDQNEMVLNNAGGLGTFNPATLLPDNPAFTIGTDNSSFAYMSANAIINITNNKIHGFRNSVAFYDASATGRDAFTGYGNIPAGAIVNVNNNSFTGDSISINNGDVGATINASCNWYEVTDAAAVASKVTVTVIHNPWLTNGNDSSPATGFQPVAAYCNGTPVSVSLSQATNVSCYNAANGSISLAVSGGLAPFQYAWSKDAVAGFSNTKNLTGLEQGVYTFTVTDANGSSASLSVTINSPSKIVTTITDNSTACSNNAVVTAAGGSGAHSFLWSNGFTGSSLSNVAPSTYYVTATDNTGCSVIDSITLVAKPAFNPSVQTTDVTCFGGSNGILTVTNANGTAPYQYSIDGTSFQASNSFSGLVAGTYTVTVRDANGCTGFNSKTIGQPDAITISVDNVQTTCFGANAGSISISVSGGSPGYSYSWTGTGGFTSTSKNISNLPAGSYSVTVTDSKGCAATPAAILLQGTNEILVNTTVTNIACKGETNGAIALVVTGGSGAGFTYAWNNGASTASQINLASGNYNVTITDVGTGCSVSRTYTINQPASAISLSTSKINATSCSSMGVITASGSGGTGSYQYRLNNGTYQANGTFTGLAGGDYTVWVKDANDCNTSKLVSITDNGSDDFENNNSLSKAAAITIGSNNMARLALAADIDWYKFTTTSANTYTVTVTHPGMNYNIIVYSSVKNSPALVPVSVSGSSKTYVLAANSIYYINITGGLSFNCYSLSVAAAPSTTAWSGKPTAKDAMENKAVDFTGAVYPNPHKGNFDIRISSPVTANATVELVTAVGQVVRKNNVHLNKGINLIHFTRMQKGILFFRVTLNNQVITGKIIGIE